MYRIAIPAAAVLVSGIFMAQPAYAAGSHEGGHDAPAKVEETEEHHGDEAPHTAPTIDATLENMREEHQEHEHGHDFAAIEALSPEDMDLVLDAMADFGLAMPTMDSSRGRKIFVSKGCIVCHQVNAIGGEIGPSLNAADMPSPMNTFEFSARMWRGAGAMIQMQEDLFGGQIDLTGQDLADLVAFAHDANEQQKLTSRDIPEKFRDFIAE